MYMCFVHYKQHRVRLHPSSMFAFRLCCDTSAQRYTSDVDHDHAMINAPAVALVASDMQISQTAKTLAVVFKLIVLYETRLRCWIALHSYQSKSVYVRKPNPVFS